MWAYSTGFITGAAQFAILSSLVEVDGKEKQENRHIFDSIKNELYKCFLESLAFLRSAKKAVLLMLCNSFVGAIDILLLFFLQAKLPRTRIPGMLLGVLLFVMQLGGIIGSKVILLFPKIKYKTLYVLSVMSVVFGVCLEHSGIAYIMTLGVLFSWW